MKPKLEEYKIDETDKKIIGILLEDSRTPTTEMAMKLKISHDSVNYRIKNLVKHGVIKQFTIVPDQSKLGYKVLGDIAVSLWNMTQVDQNEFEKYIKFHPFIVSAWHFSGKWDYYLEIFARDLPHFNEIVTETKTKFSKIIKDSETLFVTKELKFNLFPKV